MTLESASDNFLTTIVRSAAESWNLDGSTAQGVRAAVVIKSLSSERDDVASSHSLWSLLLTFTHPKSTPIHTDKHLAVIQAKMRPKR